MFSRVKLAPRARLERATYGLGNRCSVQLSYRGMKLSGMIGQVCCYRQAERAGLLPPLTRLVNLIGCSLRAFNSNRRIPNKSSILTARLVS